MSWYRKEFVLPKEAASRRVYLQFEGIFRSADFWLNGKWIGHHSSGYVGVELPLTAADGALFGGKNVIAVRVDPRANEGWWYEG